MPITAATLAQIIEKWAPPSLMASWDNGGFQAGDPCQRVKGLLVALDVDSSSLAAARRHGANMIVSHHPLIFKPLRDLRLDRPWGALAAKIIQENLIVYCAHTNLDQAPGGTDDLLAKLLGLDQVQVLRPSGEAGENYPGRKEGDKVLGFGRIGELKSPLSLAELVQWVKRRLELDHVRVVGNPDQRVSRLALCGGSGGSHLKEAIRQKAHAFVSGDIGYHDASLAQEAGLGLIDAGHLGTEKHLIPALSEYIRRELALRRADIDVICHHPQELFRLE
ncbi:MAG: Nif3-like dinuclear metal center hexameric protein [Firmicutes bacterium]|nr:Nif3-like dinuclear metal center hexameric protein [Bacillota bacterium]